MASIVLVISLIAALLAPSCSTAVGGVLHHVDDALHAGRRVLCDATAALRGFTRLRRNLGGDREMARRLRRRRAQLLRRRRHLERLHRLLLGAHRERLGARMDLLTRRDGRVQRVVHLRDHRADVGHHRVEAATELADLVVVPHGERHGQIAGRQLVHAAQDFAHALLEILLLGAQRLAPRLLPPQPLAHRGDERRDRGAAGTTTSSRREA